MTAIGKKNDGQKKAKPPTHAAYYVRNYKEGDEEKAFWTRIGAAWLHEDGTGLNVLLETVPVDGRLTIRPVKDADEDQGEGA